MSEGNTGPLSVATAWDRAVSAAIVLAVDPAGTGVVVRAGAGPVRDRWLDLVRGLLPADTPWRRLPHHITADRLLGGLDLVATLASGRPVLAPGLLAEADRGIVVLAMAERLGAETAAEIASVLDRGRVVIARDGFTRILPARVGVIALDESEGEDAVLAGALADRLALPVDLTAVSVGAAVVPAMDRGTLEEARARLPFVVMHDDVLTALTATALALGVGGLRATLQVVAVAQIAAALRGASAVEEADARIAAGLVLSPRATVAPADAENEPPPPPPPEAENENSEQSDDETPADPPTLEDILRKAAAAAIPPGLLDRLAAQAQRRGGARANGRAGAAATSTLRGRPIGARAGLPRGGARLDLIATLRTAAPWQRLRSAAPGSARVCVRPDDLRIRRFVRHRETTTVFAVDASGSAALHRLAEAKGAVEIMLADAYVRRDRVALVTFRGRGAELILPPTRALARAKRALAGLPGGGGTPLAAGLDHACAVARAVKRQGQSVTVVVLTDGRANIARDGAPDRVRAEADAVASARGLAAAGVASVLIDTAPRPQPQAERLAAAMGAAYIALPYADAAAMADAVRAVQGPPQRVVA